jgi:hypothetical protein
MLYVIVDLTSGDQKRVSVDPLAVVDGSEELLTFTQFDQEPSVADFQWDSVTRSYVPQITDGTNPAQRIFLSRREFRERLGAQCRIAINTRLITPAENAAAVQLIAQLQDMKDELMSVDVVDLTHPTTIAGVNALVALGFLSSALGVAALVPATEEG